MGALMTFCEVINFRPLNTRYEAKYIWVQVNLICFENRKRDALYKHAPPKRLLYYGESFVNVEELFVNGSGLGRKKSIHGFLLRTK